MQKALVIIALCLVVSGCGSKAEQIETQYFVLGINDDAKSISKPKLPTGPKVALTRLKLAPHLEENGIAMIQQGNRINIANYALWGEGLGTSIPRALRNDFRLGCNCEFIDNSSSGLKPSDIAGLSLNIDRFGPTDSGYAILSGRYTMEPLRGESHGYDFDMRVDLEADGYREAILQMRKLVSMLAHDVQLKMAKQ